MAKADEKPDETVPSGVGPEAPAQVVPAVEDGASTKERLAALQDQLPPPPQAVVDTSKQAEGESWADYRARSDRGNFAERLRED